MHGHNSRAPLDMLLLNSICGFHSFKTTAQYDGESAIVAMLTGRRIHTTKVRIPYWMIGHLVVLGKGKETKRGESIKRG